ncbi:MAG: outer membrane lipoprotein-sorting protein [Pseudomonadota bacterium]|nr:outer membrane lipoprotein-sorting protein [Pseudomonadota bacterium]
MALFYLGIAALNVLLFVPAMATTTDSEGSRIAGKAYQSARGWKDYSVTLQMEIRLSDGRSASKFLKLKNLEGKNDDDKSLVVFDRPADVKGTALLTHSYSNKANDQWLYLPDLRRTKRIVSKERNQAFMGSEFTYDDMTFNDLNKFSYKFLRKENCGSLVCFLVEQTPKDKEYTYSKVLVWYDTEAYRPQKSQFFDKNSQLIKEMERKGYKKYLDKVWFASEMAMSNLQTKNTTVIRFEEFKFHAGLNEKDFSPEQISRVK